MTNIILRNWFFDITGDSQADFDTFNSTVRAFIHFAGSPATSMGFDTSSKFTIVGETPSGNKITVSGITLMSKITTPDRPNTQPIGYSVIDTSDNTYHLMEAEMDKSFRKEFISKIVHVNNFTAASF